MITCIDLLSASEKNFLHDGHDNSTWHHEWHLRSLGPQVMNDFWWLNGQRLFLDGTLVLSTMIINVNGKWHHRFIIRWFIPLKHETLQATGVKGITQRRSLVDLSNATHEEQTVYCSIFFSAPICSPSMQMIIGKFYL